MKNGDVYEGKYGPMEIVDYRGSKAVDIMFIDTAFATTTQAKHVRNGTVKDPFKPSVHGVGYLGSVDSALCVKGKKDPAYKTWNSMMTRCYAPKFHKKQPTYTDCKVCDEWHDFSVFRRWFNVNFIEGYQLDKDKLVKGNLTYSPDTCCFISHQENNEISKAKAFKIKNPTGDIIKVFNLAKFCRDNALTQSNIYKVLKGERAHHKGYTRVIL